MQILSEPARKTSDRCCGGHNSVEVEVWLYNIEVKNEDSPELKLKQFQIYFTTDGKVDETRI